MKLICLLLIMCLFAATPVYPQNKNTKRVVEDEERVFQKIDPEASPNPVKWKAHIARGVVLPDSIAASIPVGTYKAVIGFMVNVHGDLGQFNIITDPGHSLGKYALKIIKSYPEKWSPAVQCGRPVNAYRKQEIVFSVEE